MKAFEPYREPVWIAKRMKPSPLIAPLKLMHLRLDNDWTNTLNEVIHTRRKVAYANLVQLAEQALGPTDERVLWLRAHPPDPPTVFKFDKYMVKWAEARRRQSRSPQMYGRKGLDKPTPGVVESAHEK